MNNFLWATGQYFLHFKGGLYQVTGVTRSSEDPKQLSISYVPVDGRAADWDGIPWSRPAEEFFKPEPRSMMGVRYTHLGPKNIVKCSGCPFWACTLTGKLTAYCIACCKENNS